MRSCSDRADAVPTRRGRESVRSALSFHTTTRRRPRDRARRPPRDRRCDSSARPASASSGKIGVAAGDLDELFDPPDPRDQRIVPLFEERPEPTGKTRGRLADPVEIGAEPVGQRARPLPGSPTRPPSIRIIWRISATSLIERDDGDAAPNELAGPDRPGDRRTRAPDRVRALRSCRTAR